MRGFLHLKIMLWMVLLCFGADLARATDAPGVALPEKMQKMRKVLGSLLSHSSSDVEFDRPSNRAKIQNELKELKTLAHDLSHKNAFPDSDPILNYLPEHLEGDVEEAGVAYREGSRAYARSVIRTVSGFCIACHTKDDSGQKYPGVSWKPALPLEPLELAQFYSATRQFDQAEAIYSGIIQSPDAGRTTLDEAIRESLSIAIRVKKDPKLASEIVAQVAQAPDAPVFLKLNAIQWRKSIEEWKRSEKRVLETSGAMLNAARRLVESARKQQRFFSDRSADILYLRASVILHELLKKNPPPRILGEALYLEGGC